MNSVGEQLLDNLTKEDLIEIIADMQDTIQHWDEGWGYDQKDGLVLNSVGKACIENMLKSKKWNHGKRETVFDRASSWLNIQE